jgi:hypothetical protein
MIASQNLQLPDAPRAVSSGGPVMRAPEVVPVFFPEDVLRDDIEQFVSTVGATDYWSAVTGEYGVGPLTARAPVEIMEAAPTATSDQDIQRWLQGKLDGTHPEFPAPGANTLYALFYPSTTTIYVGGLVSCDGLGSYHNSMKVPGTGTPIIYAVIFRCGRSGPSALDALTLATSHELVEAVTDPQPFADPAYISVDDDHAVFTISAGGGEVADLCFFRDQTDYRPTSDHGFSYLVQRSWSNAAAATWQDPCVPAPAEVPYFGVAPRATSRRFAAPGRVLFQPAWRIPFLPIFGRATRRARRPAVWPIFKKSRGPA